MKNLYLTFLFMLYCLVLHSGCMVILEASEGAEIAAEVPVAAAERGVLAEAAEGLSRVEMEELAAEGISAEDIALFRNSSVEIRAGRLVSAEETAFNNELGRIRISRSAGENPKLYMDGFSKPFGEIYTDEGTVHIYSLNRSFSIQNNIFSVENEMVRVLNRPGGAGDNVVGIVHKGDLVVKLSEEGDWYQVNILKNGEQATGFISSAFLAPLVLGTAIIDSAKTSAEAIRNEVNVRWEYYWKSMRSVEMTAQDAMAILYTDFGRKEYSRKISFSTNEWEIGVNDFLQIQIDNIPILSDNKFSSDSLKIIGFTKANEVLQLVQVFNQSVYLKNPMNWGPDNFGEWTQVRTLDGIYGWVYTKPYLQQYANGVAIKRAVEIKQDASAAQVDTTGASDNSIKYVSIIVVVILLLIVIAARSRQG